MQFNAAQKAYFRADTGAFSEVTDREIFDSQITLTDHEQALTEDFFRPAGIYIGNVKNSKGASRKPFTLHPSEQKIELNLVYPKPNRPDELRLYLKKAIFKPRKGSYWYIFTREGQIFLGQMDKRIWDSKFHDDETGFSTGLDDDTSTVFQNRLLVGSSTDVEVPDLIIRTQKSHKRSAKLVRDVVLERGPICEVYPEYPTFTSYADKRPYVEAHHFIPMGLQGRFTTSLDVAENICVLNPVTHRLLHSGIAAEVAPAMDVLLKARIDFIHGIGLDCEDVANIYLRT